MNKILSNLSVRQRISIGLMAVLMGGGIFWFVRHQREADFKPLFTGLAPEDAAAIMQKLKEAGVDYRLPDNGGSVLVPSTRLAELRLTLAAAGLPKTGRIGFELFDKVNLGATEFAEHVNYRRALEGELERSIMALAEVEQARVHLTFPKESVFLDQQKPAKASVMVRVKPGKRLIPQNVLAIDHLVASAVEGLSPDAVSVLDMKGNLLGRPRPQGSLDESEPSELVLDFRHKLEADLVAKINSTLGPLLGENKFRTGVSVECDFSAGELSEEVFDPARSVMLNSQRTEDSTSGAGGANGVPGTASSLPRPATRPGATSKSVSRTTENVTYQSSRTVKKTRLPAGILKKMSIAVLVDQEVQWEQQPAGPKRVLIPPRPEKLKVLRDLVAGIVGFTESRGDQIVIETLPFETTMMIEPPPSAVPPAAPAAPPPSPWAKLQTMDRKTRLIAGGVAGAVILLVLFAAFKLMRRGKGRSARAAALSTGPAALQAGESAPSVPGDGPTEALEQRMENKLAERDALQQKAEAQALQALKVAPVITKTAEVLAKHLREKVSKESEMTAQLLRTWIHEEEN